MTNKIDKVLKAINDRMTGALPSDMVKNPKLNVNSTYLILSARSYPTEDPQCSSHSLNLINAIKTCSIQTSNRQKDQLQMVNEFGTSKPKEPTKALEVKFKDLHLNLPVLKVQAHTLIYKAMLDKYPCMMIDGGLDEYKIGLEGSSRDCFGDSSLSPHFLKIFGLSLDILEYFSLVFDFSIALVSSIRGRGFLATSNAVIDCRKAIIAVGEEVKESEDLIENTIDWNKTPKGGDGAWHAKIRLIDPDGEKFTKTFQSIPTTRKLSEKENPLDNSWMTI
ncbi:hypothetical protein Tco_0324592 [Tanacetum coccineum]